MTVSGGKMSSIRGTYSTPARATSSSTRPLMSRSPTALLTCGNGAAFQRTAYRQSGRLSDVISSAVHVTEGD